VEESNHNHHPFSKGVVKSMGLVFGDIGTSPIYTLTVIFLLVPPTPGNLVGIVSLIVWTLIILVTVQYVWLAMQLGLKGEGGTIVLREILIPLLKTGRVAGFISLLSIIGIALLIGDGVITPAISILSAVEGFRLVPGAEDIAQIALVWIAAFITIGLFAFQRSGTERVAWAFGPIMVLWFVALSVSGVLAIFQAPAILLAINPLNGLTFFLTHGIAAFFVLSQVILCATGGEALFADMGHLGREPIRRAWIFVFVALSLNYLGQGAFLLENPGAKNVLFEMIYTQSPLIYIPFLALSIAATVIASQAMISGVFSIAYQGVTTRIFPLLKIDYTSAELRSQIYIDSVNWFLMFAVLLVLFIFQASVHLAAAYGLAVMGTMTITGIMVSMIFFKRNQYIRMLIAIAVTGADFIYLFSATFKIPAGGYWSLIIASVPFAIIMIYIYGQRRLFAALHPMDIADFLKGFVNVYENLEKIKGTAIFFARDVHHVPAYIAHTIFKDNILYEKNVIITIKVLDSPFGISWWFEPDLAPGLQLFVVQYGYMERINLKEIIESAKIGEKTIFYGMEEIVTDNIVWKVFSAIKRLSPSFVQYYKLPADKVHGVVSRVEM
jgi:KUP system potassium uptake protein